MTVDAEVERLRTELRDAQEAAANWEAFAMKGGWEFFMSTQRADLIAAARTARAFLSAGPEGSVDAPNEYIALRAALEKL